MIMKDFLKVVGPIWGALIWGAAMGVLIGYGIWGK